MSDTIPQDDIPRKLCTKCGQEFPATPEFFTRNRHRADGLEHCKACRQAYRRRPGVKERTQVYNKTYDRGHRRRIRERSHVNNNNYRARKMGVRGKHTPEQIQAQLKRQKCQCYYCKAKFERRYIYHVEHTYPLSRVAGSDIPANESDYLVLACPTCNRSKHDKYPWEFPKGNRLL